MAESLPRKYRLNPLGDRNGAHRRAVCSRSANSRAVVLPFTQLEQRRAHPTPIAPLKVIIRQLVAAIRLWHMRAGSRQKLHELSDHMLKDIGLRREHLLFGYPKPIRRLD